MLATLSPSPSSSFMIFPLSQRFESSLSYLPSVTVYSQPDSLQFASFMRASVQSGFLKASR
jgi:hypothetical protein